VAAAARGLSIDEAYLEEHGLRGAEGPWESYVDDAATTPHDKLRTEVFWPLKR